MPDTQCHSTDLHHERWGSHEYDQRWAPLAQDANYVIIFINRDVSIAINNVVNFLVTVNAASNFLLYCALSDKYRKTVRALVCGHKPIRKSILTSSRYNSGRTSTTFFSKSQSNGNHSSASIPKVRNKVKKRFSITQEEFANLQAETARLKYPRLSITPSDNRKNSSVWPTCRFLSYSYFEQTVFVL